MPTEPTVNLRELLERVAHKLAAGDATLESTEDVELHAPIPHQGDRRPELPPETEAALRRTLGTGEPRPAAPSSDAVSDEDEAMPPAQLPRLRPRGTRPFGKARPDTSDDGHTTRRRYGR